MSLPLGGGTKCIPPVGRPCLPLLFRKRLRGREHMCEELVRTGCKINLFLFITGKRGDGYHEISTLFVRVPEPCDTLIFRPARRRGGLRVQCSAPGIDPAQNTLVRAAECYAEATGFAPAVDVKLLKGIPCGSGLGGGSADGAEVLLWLQRKAPHPLAEENLLSIASLVGADVPFFLREGPCLAEGIGDILVPVQPALEGWWCVLACPAVHVSTAWAYAAWDAERDVFPLTGNMKVDTKNCSICQNFYGRNDFESVVFAAHPELLALKTQLLRHGADMAGMSGSGSALFGLFRDRECAIEAAAAMRREKGMMLVSGPFVF